jgi:predicted Zn-dependent peptidase
MAQEESRLKIHYTSFVLPNGLTVILHEDHSIPAVAVDAGIKALQLGDIKYLSIKDVLGVVPVVE